MTEHDAAAAEHLEQALADEAAAGPWMHLGAAGVHAVLHLAEAIKHGIRDVVYELRD